MMTMRLMILRKIMAVSKVMTVMRVMRRMRQTHESSDWAWRHCLQAAIPTWSPRSSSYQKEKEAEKI